MTRRKMYEPTPTQRELDEDERARAFAERQAERERATGMTEDAAARWLAENDPASKSDRPATVDGLAAPTRKKQKPQGVPHVPQPSGSEGERERAPRRPGQPGRRRRVAAATAPARVEPAGCDHAWASIHGIGGALLRYFCLRCETRRPATHDRKGKH